MNAKQSEIAARLAADIIGNNRKHGWGQADSAEAILRACAAEVGSDVPSLEGIRPIVHFFSNPSAVRQQFEPADGYAGLIDKSEASRKRSHVRAAVSNLTI